MKKFARFAALAMTLTGSVVLGGSFNIAHAQAPMAPPVQDTYNWRDVPANQQIEITRAVFDQGGYQLYASTGELIVVPFENQNLYVMKFGQTGGGMYFVNDGLAPTLYVPAGGYLENAGAEGARWYPFPQNYHYTAPMYMGFAPSWDDYYHMGWYPGMVYYGGYSSYRPWHVGVSFSPLPGLFINIGGHPYYGWNSYHHYYYDHPYNRVYVNNFHTYDYHAVPHRPTTVFVTNHNHYVTNHTTVVHGGGFGRPGTTVIHSGGSFGHPDGGHAGFGGDHSTRPFSGGDHVSRPFGGGDHTSRPFGSGDHASRPFGGGETHSGGGFGGGDHTSRPFGGGDHTSRPFGGSDHASRPFGGGTTTTVHTGGSFGHGSTTTTTHTGGSFGHASTSTTTTTTHTGGSFGGGRHDDHGGDHGGDHHDGSGHH